MIIVCHDSICCAIIALIEISIRSACTRLVCVISTTPDLHMTYSAAVRTADRPLDWRGYAAEFEVCYGPDTCNGDSLLREPSVGDVARHLLVRLGAEAFELDLSQVANSPSAAAT